MRGRHTVERVKAHGTAGGRLGVAAGTALVMGVSAACGGGSGTGEAESRTLQFQEIYAPGNAFADATQAYGDAVTAASDGQLDFEYHWSSSVVPSNEVAAAMDDGLLDMARLQPPASPADFPVTNWLASAATYGTEAFPAGLLQQIGAHLEFALNSPELESELGALGVRYIAPLALVQQYDLLCKNPVESPADLQGVPIRVAGEAWVAEAENLGATPVTLLPEEIYEGYQRGVVDCVMTYPTHYVDSGLWELGGYHVPVSLTGWNQDAIAISRATWDELSPEAREALLGEVRVWIETFVQQQLEKHWRFVTEAADNGVTLLDPVPEIQESIDAHHERVREQMIADAPAGVEDPAALLDRYEELHDEWLGIVQELGFDTESQGVRAWVDGMNDPSQPPQIDLDPWLDRVMEQAYGSMDVSE